MNSNELIDQLTKEHKEIKPPKSILKRFLNWLGISIFCLIAGISSLGLREDWSSLFSDPLLLLQNIFIIFYILLCALMALRFSQPDRLNEKKGHYIVFGFFTLWTLILSIIILIDGGSLENFSTPSYSCIRDILIIGLIPGVSINIFIRQGVVLKRFLTTAIGMLASFGLGAWAVQFTCHNDDPVHILLWHFTPLIIICIIGAYLGKKLLKKL